MEARSSSWHLDDQMKKTTGDNLGVVGKNTDNRGPFKRNGSKDFQSEKIGKCLYACNLLDALASLDLKLSVSE